VIKALLEGPEMDLPQDVLLYQLALTQQELGLEPESRQTLQRLVDEHPQSAYAAEAQSELGAGLAGNPMAGL
jgi:predicted Zn-dependent protease